MFIVLRPAQEYLTYIATSPLLVKGCTIQAYARHSGPLSMEESLSCHTCCEWSLGTGLIQRTAPFSRLLRHTRGCGGSILTWILTFVRRLKIFKVFNSFLELRFETNVLKNVLKGFVRCFIMKCNPS